MKKIFIEKINNISKYALLENREIKNLIVNDSEKSYVNNIYVGRVMNIINKNFAFINIGLEKNGFLDLNDHKESFLVEKQETKRKLLIKQGDSILVQVIKDATGDKGVALTSQVNFLSKHLVIYKSKFNNIGVSKKINIDKKICELKEFGLSLSKNEYSIIFRTEAQHTTLDGLKVEFENLKEKHKKIYEKSQFIAPPSLVLLEENKDLKIIEDIIDGEVDEIFLNNKKQYEALKKEFDHKEIEITLLSEAQSLNYSNLLNNKMEKLFHKKIWLKSGGHLIIEETEACVVIDVNSSKSINHKNKNQLVTKINLEAVVESSRQIKLRNLSGIILIDLLDMKYDTEKHKLIKIAQKIFKDDKIRSYVVGITDLGIMEITRKKKRESISKILRKKCVCCDGIGTTPKPEVIFNDIFRNLFYSVINTTFNRYEILVNKKIETYIRKNKKLLEELQINYNISIEVKIIETGKVEYFEINKYTNS